MNPCRRDFKWTPSEIAEAVVTRLRWPGFSGERCHECEKTANVPFGSGWVCVCGALNPRFLSRAVPHKHPQLGPSQRVLNRARKLLVYPPYVAQFLLVRRRRLGDRRWQIVMVATDGTVWRPDWLYYKCEGSREEIDLWVEKIKNWPQHRDFTLLVEEA